MALHVAINTKAFVDLSAYLVGMEHRLEDLTVPLTEASILILRDVKNAFATGGASIGESWKPHSKATIERWGEHQFGQGPTGNLEASLQRFVRKFVCGVESHAPHAHLFENGKHSLASIATAGGTIKRRHSLDTPGDKNQEGREFLRINLQTEEQIINLILDYAVLSQQKAA